MPIENLEEVKNNGEMVVYAPLFSSSNLVVAGQIKVKHPLLDKSLILYGFVIEDQYFNENDFLIQGMRISYQKKDKYYASNHTIYPKIIIDNNRTPFYELFDGLDPILYRSWDGQAEFEITRDEVYEDEEEYNKRCKYEYYLFDKVNKTYPTCAARQIYAVCKYIEEGIFKYALFSFHELMPE